MLPASLMAWVLVGTPCAFVQRSYEVFEDQFRYSISGHCLLVGYLTLLSGRFTLWVAVLLKIVLSTVLAEVVNSRWTIFLGHPIFEFMVTRFPRLLGTGGWRH